MRVLPGRRSAVYNALTDAASGGLLFGVGDMAIHAEVTPEVVKESRDLILGPDTRERSNSIIGLPSNE